MVASPTVSADLHLLEVVKVGYFIYTSSSGQHRVRRVVGFPQVCLLPLDWLKSPRHKRGGGVAWENKSAKEKSICSSASRLDVDRVRHSGAGKWQTPSEREKGKKRAREKERERWRRRGGEKGEVAGDAEGKEKKWKKKWQNGGCKWWITLHQVKGNRLRNNPEKGSRRVWPPAGELPYLHSRRQAWNYSRMGLSWKWGVGRGVGGCGQGGGGVITVEEVWGERTFIHTL